MYNNDLVKAYAEREEWRKNNVRKPISKQRQKELLKLYPRSEYLPLDHFTLSEEEIEFLMVDRILHSKYAENMSIFDFLKL